MHMNEPPIECSDPEAAIVVPEKPVGIDGLSAGHGIQFGLPVDELSHSARHGNEQFSLLTRIQIIELRARHRIVRWRTGPPSPKTQLRTGPEITCAVLKQRQDRSAERAVLPVALHTAVSYRAEPARGITQGAEPYCPLMVLMQRCHELVIKL